MPPCRDELKYHIKSNGNKKKGEPGSAALSE